MYRYTCVYNFKRCCINKDKKICLPKKECLIGHRCERTDMAVKSRISINCSKNFIGIKEYDYQRREYLKGHKCEGKRIAYKCKSFVAII